MTTCIRIPPKAGIEVIASTLVIKFRVGFVNFPQLMCIYYIHLFVLFIISTDEYFGQYEIHLIFIKGGVML